MRDDLYQRVVQTIGTSPATWPGGWPGEIEAALLDAVFSVRARYGSRTNGTGVFGAVTRWREEQGGRADDLCRLASADEAELRRITNNGRLSGRRRRQSPSTRRALWSVRESCTPRTFLPGCQTRGPPTCRSRAAVL